jgi:hypothetical protein
VIAAAARTRVVTALLVVAALGLAGCTDPDPDDGPPPAPAPTFDGGDDVPREPLEGGVLGAKWDQARSDVFDPYLRELGAGPTFSEVVWCDVEPEEGQRSWTGTDAFVERATDVAGTVMLKIRVGQCWTTGQAPQAARGSKTESGVPLDTQAYRDFVTELVQRYAARGVSRFAVENEVNSPSFWAGTPQEYRELAEVASDAIRAAAPQALVLDSGLSSVSYGYGAARRLLDDGRDDEAVATWNTYYERRMGTRGRNIVEAADVADLEALLEREQALRSIEHLEVASALAADGVVDVRQVHFYETWRGVPALFGLLRATTPQDVPLELWEVGLFVRGQDVPIEQAADETVQTSATLLAHGAALVVWLPLAFNPSGRNPDEPRTGLLEPQGEVRPTGERYAELAAAARDAVPVPVETADVVGIGFEGPAGTSAFVWSLGGEVSADSGGGAVSIGTAPTRVELEGTVEEFVAGLP